MEGETDSAVPSWLGGLKTGEPAAFQRLWDYYFAQVIRLARLKMRALAIPGDEEDVVQSAFGSFYRAITRGAFPRLETHGDLWQILVSLTTRKAIDRRRRQSALRRGGPPGAQAVATTSLDAAMIEDLVGKEPDPQFQSLVADELDSLFRSLKDDQMRQIALLKLEGYTNEEIAGRIDCSQRTVERRLEMIRRRWSEATPT